VAGTALVASAWVLVYWGGVLGLEIRAGPLTDFARKRATSRRLRRGQRWVAGDAAALATDFNLHIPANAILAVAADGAVEQPAAVRLGALLVQPALASKCAATLVLLADWRIWDTRDGAGRGRIVAARAMRTPAVFVCAHCGAGKAAEAQPMNFATTMRLGSATGPKSSTARARNPGPWRERPMEWYQRGMKLDPYDGYNWLRYGMCLDKFSPDEGRRREAEPYYKRADELDPNGYYMSANIGWHYMQTGLTRAGGAGWSVRAGWNGRTTTRLRSTRCRSWNGC